MRKWTWLGDKTLCLHTVYDDGVLEARALAALFPEIFWEEGVGGWEVYRRLCPAPEHYTVPDVVGYACRRALLTVGRAGRWLDSLPVLRAREAALALLLARFQATGVPHLEPLARAWGKAIRIRARTEARLAGSPWQALLGRWVALEAALGLEEGTLAHWADIAPQALPQPPLEERSHEAREKEYWPAPLSVPALVARATFFQERNINGEAELRHDRAGSAAETEKRG